MALGETTGIHIGQDQFQAVDINKKLNNRDNNVQGASLYDLLNNWLIAHSGVKTKEMVIFYRLLATMINAGVTLVKALEISEKQGENIHLQRVVGSLRQLVERGQPLSVGMSYYADVFDEAYVGMVHSGEATGQLNDTLLQIAEQMEARSKMSSKIKGAMMYPMGVVVVLIAVFFAVTTLVVPKLKDTFEAAGAALPASTQFLITMSDFLLGAASSVINKTVHTNKSKSKIIKYLEKHLDRSIAPTSMNEKKFNIFNINLEGGW